jgi:hypothetical protein
MRTIRDWRNSLGLWQFVVGTLEPHNFGLAHSSARLDAMLTHELPHVFRGVRAKIWSDREWSEAEGRHTHRADSASDHPSPRPSPHAENLEQAPILCD